MVLERKFSTVHVGCQPSNLSFSGCGFLGVYHIGVASCFRQHAPEFLKRVKKIYGCSAGSIIGAMLLSDVCSGELCRSTLEIVKDVRSRYLGPLSPGFRPYRILREGFQRVLPPDAHKRCHKRLYISLTRVSDMKNIIVSEYSTRDELIDALLCSSFVPFYSGFIPPKYRGVYYVDGGLTNNLPDGSDTITISPWSGGSDICPTDSSANNPLDVNIANTSVQMTVKNLQRLSRMLFPPEGKILSDFCKQGFREALRYLTEHGLFETVNPTLRSMSFSSELEQVDARRMQFRQLSMSSKWKAMQTTNKDFIEEICWLEDETDSNTSDSDYLTMSADHRSECVSSDEHDGISSAESTNGLESKEQHELEPNKDDFPWKDYFEDNPLLKLIPIATIVDLPSTSEELDKILHSNLPHAVMKALDECQFDSNGHIGSKLGKIASICGKPLSLTKTSIEKSYSLAMYALKHASYVPGNMKYLLTRISTLVSDLEEATRANCNDIIKKLLNSTEKVSEEVKLLFCKLFIVIQILVQKLISNMPTVKLPWVSKLASYCTASRITNCV